jgi:hypothetical protein
LIDTACQLRTGEFVSVRAPFFAGLEFFGAGGARGMNKCGAAEQHYKKQQPPHASVHGTILIYPSRDNHAATKSRQPCSMAGSLAQADGQHVPVVGQFSSGAL